MNAPPTLSDRLWAAFRTLIRTELAELPYLATYEYQVSKITGDTVQAQPTTSDIPTPGIIQLPLRVGLPGAKVVPSKGSLLYVVFANGDGAKPRVIGYDSNTSQSIALDTGTLVLDSGHGSLEHATSIEAICNLIINLAAAIATASPGTPWAVTDAVLAQAVAACSSSTPTPLTLAAIEVALLGKTGPLTNIGWPNTRGA